MKSQGVQNSSQFTISENRGENKIFKMFFVVLLGVLEVLFWCILAVTAISFGTTDAKNIYGRRNRKIRKYFKSAMKADKLLLTKSSINIEQIVDRLTNPSSESASIPKKRYLSATQIVKLKYSNDLRKVCYYNQISKDFKF